MNTADKSETHKAIERHLGHELERNEYNSGMFTDPKTSKKMRLSTLLPDELKNEFKRDNTRKEVKTNHLSVLTTRSKEGVAGQTSHGQTWENSSCKNFTNGGNSHYLQPEYESGTVVSYLRNHTGKELARTTFHPYLNKEGNTIYKINSTYGISHPEFEKHNEEMEMRLSKEHSGDKNYNIHPKVYNDSGVETTLHPTYIRSLITNKDADPDNIIEAIHQSSSNRITKRLAAHKNLTPKHIEKLSHNPIMSGFLKTQIINHPNTTDHAISNVVDTIPSTEHDLLNQIYKHKKTGDETLSRLANKRITTHQWKQLYNDPRIGDQTISRLLLHVNDDAMAKHILKEKSHIIGSSSLNILANHHKALHHDIINHEKIDDQVLSHMIRNTEDKSLAQKIINHKNFGDLAMKNMFMNKSIPHTELVKMVIDRNNK